MLRDNFEQNVADLVHAIDGCVSERLFMPALVLVYVGMDTMAWLARGESHDDVQRSDFIAWIDAFLDPRSALGCTAGDLYAARCGVLHSYSPVSRMSRSGEASELWYAWGSATAESLKVLLANSSKPHTLVIHVNDLVAAFKSALSRFVAHLEAHPEEVSLVYSRAGKCFGSIPQNIDDSV